jgi:hypothetical protein
MSFCHHGLVEKADEQRTEMDSRFLEFWSAAINVRAKQCCIGPNIQVIEPVNPHGE